MNVECVVLQWYASGFTICPLCKPSFEVRNCRSHMPPHPHPHPHHSFPAAFSIFNGALFTSTTIPVQLAKHTGPRIKCAHTHLSSLKSSFPQSQHTPPPPPSTPPSRNDDSKLAHSHAFQAYLLMNKRGAAGDKPL